MSDLKDSAIKLFGRTIKLPEIPSEKTELENGLDFSARSADALIDIGAVRHRSCSPIFIAEGIDLGRNGEKPDSSKGISEGVGVKVDISNELIDQNGIKENPKALSLEEQNDSQDKTLKKPDNLLPCPRCNSLDTKFCYYNNYNVSQPRHFCKNCHRYWTDGGTIRNVAVGSSRRKNKNVASQCRQLTVLETPQNGLLPPGSNGHLCDSIGSVSVHDRNSNGYSPVNFSMPFLPAAWTVPWLNSLPGSQKYENPNNGNNSSTSGRKHSRDDDSMMKRPNLEKDEPLKGNNNTEKCLWVPKTSIVVDQEESSKSSRPLSFHESSRDKARRT